MTSARIPLIMAARLIGLVALGLGIAWWLGATLPLHVHMGAGGLFVLLLLGLAGLAWRAGGRGSAAIGVVLGLALPVIGMAQLSAGESRPVVQIVHVLVALVAIGWAERLSALVKRAPRPTSETAVE